MEFLLHLDGVSFLGILEVEVGSLFIIFIPLEVDLEVASIDESKSLRPNGFNFRFYKNLWALIRDEVYLIFSQFFDKYVLPRSLTSFFVALILKMESPLELVEFRPISLQGSLYKLVANYFFF